MDMDESMMTSCGTPLYMAPQIVNFAKYSYKADVWSLGVICFEILNSETPFHSKSRKEFKKKIKKGKYNFLPDVNKDKFTLECILFISECL